MPEISQSSEWCLHQSAYGLNWEGMVATGPHIWTPALCIGRAEDFEVSGYGAESRRVRATTDMLESVQRLLHQDKLHGAK